MYIWNNEYNQRKTCIRTVELHKMHSQSPIDLNTECIKDGSLQVNALKIIGKHSS